MHRCKILHFNRTWSKLGTKLGKICRRQVYKIRIHIYVHLLVSLPLYYTGIHQYRTIKVIPTYFDWHTYMQRSYLHKNVMPFHVIPHDSYVHQPKHVAITYIFCIDIHQCNKLDGINFICQLSCVIHSSLISGNRRMVMAVELPRKKIQSFAYCFPINSSFIAKEGGIFQHVSRQLLYSRKRLEKHQDKLTLSREKSSVKFGDSIQCLEDTITSITRSSY